jgi:2-hydroxychromene-2-carboxylate isomerase
MNLLKAASTVSLLTLASRVTGLLREQLIAASFGASAATDAFNVAFRIPNLLRRLFAEGAFSPFGRMLDPIGKPVMDGFSLFPWARDQGRGAELLSSFLRCAFTEAVDTSTPAGMRRVVEEAGLSWEDALPLLGNGDWRDEVESNRLSMYEELGLWGVPSYRVMGPAGEPDWSAWGQDRLWRVAQEIRRRAAL